MKNSNVIEIKKWLLDKALRQVDIAAQANVRKSVVWNTIHGYRRDHRVIKVLEALGCPVNFEKKAA